MRAVVFTGLGVVWFSLGMGLIIAPAWFIEILARLASDEFRIFILIQLGMVLSLALVVGTAGFSFRALWILVGCVGLAKGLFLLWSPVDRREAFLDWWFKRPFWVYRAWGMVMIGLATTLAYGIIGL